MPKKWTKMQKILVWKDQLIIFYQKRIATPLRFSQICINE